MNERIDELIEECTSVNDDLVYDGRDSYMKTTEYFDKEKFAELIVQECLNQCYNRGMDDELYAGQLKAATYIEEYFGVEE